jgi:hypothetical protein
MADKLSGLAIEPGTITSVQLSSELGPVTSQLELVGSGVSLNVSNNAVFSGNIAIGVSSPLARTHIIPKSEFSTAYNNYDGDALFIDDANANTGAGNYGGAISWSRLSNPPSRKAAIAIFQDTADINQNGLAFFVSPGASSSDPIEEAVRISSSKNVGIGTTLPAEKLHVVGDVIATTYYGSNTQYFLYPEGTSYLRSAYFLNNPSGGGYVQIGQNYVYGTDDVTGGSFELRNNGNSFITGNVGIGTTSPSSALHLHTSLAAIDVLRITNGTLQLNLGVNNTAGGSYVFETSANALRFGTTNTERMRITAVGNVGIGTTNPSEALDISNAANIALSTITASPTNDASLPGHLNFKGFGWNTSLGSQPISGRISLGAGYSPNNGLANPSLIFSLQNSNESITEVGRVTREGSYVLRGGTTTYESGVGIIFPATQVASSNANSLDDYEEGSWTPAIDRLSSSPSVSYSNQIGTYVKIGRMVFCFFDMTASSISGGSGSAAITGLPFTVRSNMAGFSVGQYRDASAITAGAASTNLKGYAERGAAYINLQLDNTGANGFGFNSQAVWGSSGRITGYVIYEV